VKGAQAVYTDTWVSMGDEGEKIARMAAFSKYRADEKLVPCRQGPFHARVAPR
jgi:ornithine carbamoyltransferase